MSKNLTLKNKPLVAIPALSALITALSGWGAYVGSKGGNTLLLVFIVGMIFLTALVLGDAFGLSRKVASPLHPEGQ